MFVMMLAMRVTFSLLLMRVTATVSVILKLPCCFSDQHCQAAGTADPPVVTTRWHCGGHTDHATGAHTGRVSAQSAFSLLCPDMFTPTVWEYFVCLSAKICKLKNKYDHRYF